MTATSAESAVPVAIRDGLLPGLHFGDGEAGNGDGDGEA